MNRQEFEKYINQGGKLFVVTAPQLGAGYLNKGEIVELKNDDGSSLPAFYYPNKERREETLPFDNWTFIHLKVLEPYTVTTANHYDTLHQPIETMQANMTPEEFQGYAKGNIIKYVCRMGRKAGEDKLKEAKKIRNYAKWLIESLEGKTINPREDEQ